jgi:hypothetical protein
MPTPIIELQRRLALVGAVRIGGERPADGRRPGAKLDAWRITSPRRTLIEQAAELYGGEVSQWQSPVGAEFQVYTEAPELPVLVMPGYSLRRTYELWEGATKRTRLCDGVDEELSGGPCLCELEGVDRCDIYTRLVVALPELDTALGWRLISTGANAAHELPTMLALAEAQSGGAAFVPARLRIDQRRGVKDGQVVRYVVPTLDPGVSYAALAANTPLALPERAGNGRGYTPVPERLPTPTAAARAIEAPLADLPERLPPIPVPPRSAEPVPIPEADDPAPTPPPSPGPPPIVEPPEPEAQTKQATAAQRKKLDVLVGQLRDGGHITTRHLYDAVAVYRNTGGENVVAIVGGYDADMVMHWAPLRESLTRVEATKLIDRLEAFQSDLRGAAV